MKKAIFLDRDGTLNADTGYIRRVEDFVLFEETPRALKILSQAGYALIVVTNQSGVSRGFLTLEELLKIHVEMERELAKSGVCLTAIYGCSHHPDENCSCRKPSIGLFEKAAREHDLDLRDSFMLGDKLIDVQAGLAAGCQAIWIDRRTRNSEERRAARELAHFTASTLLNAAHWIIDGWKNTRSFS